MSTDIDRFVAAILYEDNHLLIVNKPAGMLVQADLSGDASLEDLAKQYLKVHYDKAGNAFLGVPHRLDRPVSGIVIFAKTSKALVRLNRMFQRGEVHKTYWAIVQTCPSQHADILTHHLVRNEQQNKSFAFDSPVPHSKEARLRYKVIANSKKYFLVEIELLTGRHHQIRCQLSKIGCPIKGDIKYGFARTNPSGSISLHAHSVDFVHPVGGKVMHIEAVPPQNDIFEVFDV